MARHIFPIHRRHLTTDPFNFLRQEIDRLFDTTTNVQGIRPDIEVKENKTGLQISAELPGLTDKDIDISISKGVLTISGEKKSEETKEGETYYISERNYGFFSRSIKLPYEPDEKKITASFKDGILQMNIPRPKVTKPNVHKIQIKNK